MVTSYMGKTIRTNSLLTEHKEVHRRPRKWARRVLYQRDREFDFTFAAVPSRQIIQFGDTLVMHPETLRELERCIAQQEADNGQ